MYLDFTITVTFSIVHPVGPLGFISILRYDEIIVICIACAQQLLLYIHCMHQLYGVHVYEIIVDYFFYLYKYPMPYLRGCTKFSCYTVSAVN